jgi:hypothetical protein
MISLRLAVCEALLVFSTRAKQTAKRNHSFFVEVLNVEKIVLVNQLKQ